MARGAVIGDSHTSAVVGDGPGPWPGLSAEDIASSIGLENLGLSGSTTGHWLGTTAYSFPGQPAFDDVWTERLVPTFPLDVVVVSLGANDNWLEFGQYAVRLPLLIQRLLNADVKEVHVAQPLPQPTWGADGYPTHFGPFPLATAATRLATIRAQTADIVAAFDRRVTYLAIPSGFVTVGHFGPADGDSNHMNAAGHAKYRKLFTQHLRWRSAFHFYTGTAGKPGSN